MAPLETHFYNKARKIVADKMCVFKTGDIFKVARFQAALK